jgi:hypothetical protein
MCMPHAWQHWKNLKTPVYTRYVFHASCLCMYTFTVYIWKSAEADQSRDVLDISLKNSDFAAEAKHEFHSRMSLMFLRHIHTYIHCMHTYTHTYTAYIHTFSPSSTTSRLKQICCGSKTKHWWMSWILWRHCSLGWCRARNSLMLWYYHIAKHVHAQAMQACYMCVYMCVCVCVALLAGIVPSQKLADAMVLLCALHV